MRDCLARRAQRLRGHAETIGERFERDRAVLLPLPVARFEACDKTTVRVSAISLVRYRINDYSVPTQYGHRQVLLKAYVHRIAIISGCDVIAEHKRSYEREATVYDPLHYLALLEHKSRALDQAAPLSGWQLPDCFAQQRRLLEARLKKYAAHLPFSGSDGWTQGFTPRSSSATMRFANSCIGSPPYNIGKEYETHIELDRYLEWQEKIIAEIIPRLKQGGSLCWQVGNYVDENEIFPLDIEFAPIFKKYKLQLRNRIVWQFGHGLHTQRRFSGRYEVVLWYTNTRSSRNGYVFNLDAVRVPAKYPGKKHFKGPNISQFSGNPLGKTNDVIVRRDRQGF